MDKNYIIEHMTKKEISLAIDWAAKEGWNPGLHDAECFYQTDPQGFFVGKLDGKIIAMGSAVIYDKHFAFCGLYVVDEPYRGQGYGLALTKQRLAYIGQRNAGIDGVLGMLTKYERLGYRIAHNNSRYTGSKLYLPVKEDQAIKPLNQINFDQIAAYDRLHFPAPRLSFLQCWLHQPDSLGLGYMKDKQLRGYGLIRTCQQGFKIGPLFADTATIADCLFANLVNYAKGEMIYLDIPENNPNAIALVKHYQLEKVFETARMYLKGSPTLAFKQIYGIATFELG